MSFSGKYLVTGSSGQLGSALIDQLRLQGISFISWDRSDVDLEVIEALSTKLDALSKTERISAVFHPAAWTLADTAELNPERAWTVNVEATSVIAQWAARHKIPMIYFSTDYVFPGTGTQPWREQDPPSPLNIYGKTKQAGEKAVQNPGGPWLIFRTSWVYASVGRNFPNTLLERAKKQKTLNVVEDQIGAPTYAPHLASAAVAIFEKALSFAVFPKGIYHLCGAGEVSRLEFSRMLFESAYRMGAISFEPQLCPITTVSLAEKIQRPLNSRLCTEKVRQTFSVTLPDWKDGLREYLRAKFTAAN